jgi:O-antigen/teichoic acid export membrane protein
LSFTTIFAIFIDLGLSNVLIREIAKARNRAGEFLGGVLAIKLPLAAASLLSAVAAVNILGYPGLTRQLVYLACVCMLLDSFTLTFFGLIRGFHNLKFESFASVMYQMIAMSFGLFALKMNFGLFWVLAAQAVASIGNFTYSLGLLKFKWKLPIRPVYDRVLIKWIIGITAPFALFAVFQRLYTYFDTVLLSLISGDKYVGLYQIAFKITFALQFLPMAFIASLYPAFASYWQQNREQLVVSFERAMNYLIIISLPISIGIIALADKIILLFKPEYMSAVLPLRLAMVALFFIFINFPVGALLNACDRQRINTRNMGITLASSIILNLLFIPRWQAAGASLTVVVSNIILFTLNMSHASRIIAYRPRKIISTLLKALLSTAIMALAVMAAKHALNIFVVIILSGCIYFFTLFLMGGFRKEDIAGICASFGKKA